MNHHLFQSQEDIHEKEIEHDIKARQFSESASHKNRRMTTGELDITRKDRIYGKEGRRQTIAGEFDKFERSRAKEEGTSGMTTNLLEMKLREIEHESSEMDSDNTVICNDKIYQVNNE